MSMGVFPATPMLPFRAMADTGLTVVGAGVVGLAVAARLAPQHKDLVVLERQARHGQETSSRNSEVIHAGLYYPQGSLKARLCVEGNHRLYELCARHGVAHARLGKLVVATAAEELPALEALYALGTANGAPLQMLTAEQSRALEPEVPAVAALLSPSSGVLSVHGLMDALLREALAAGAVLQAHNELVAVERAGGDYRLTTRAKGRDETFTSERVVNAAGLECDTVAALAGIDPDAAGYRLHYCKGSYFALAASRGRVVSRLVYPVPSPVSLGVHAVLDVAGRLKFGPDAEYQSDRRLDYSVDESKLPAFGKAVRHLFPSVRDQDLSPDMAGIRPKLQAPNDPPRDFVIAEESARGLPGWVNLMGIDSPGLTSAPAIAEEVARLLT
jgi:L-2-hydroxyglutarate oxidase LhgO